MPTPGSLGSCRGSTFYILLNPFEPSVDEPGITRNCIKTFIYCAVREKSRCGVLVNFHSAEKQEKKKPENQRKILPYSPSSTSIDLAEAAGHADSSLPLKEENFPVLPAPVQNKSNPAIRQLCAVMVRQMDLGCYTHAGASAGPPPVHTDPFSNTLVQPTPRLRH